MVNRQTVKLYSCTMTDVPPQYRQFGSFDNSPQHYCYAVDGDYGVDGSERFWTHLRSEPLGAPFVHLSLVSGSRPRIGVATGGDCPPR